MRSTRTLIVLLVFWPTGCGREASTTIPVSGVVTFDGAALPQGKVLLQPIGAKPGSPASSEIGIDGQFTVSGVVPGEYFVAIEPRPAGNSTIPKRYTQGPTSGLHLIVKPSDKPHHLKLDLTRE